MSTQDEWSSFKLVDKHVTSIAPEATFDAKSEEIKEDILRLIVQYLQNEGYTSASATILDEANVKIMEKHQEREMVRKISKSIKEGDWDLVAKMIHKNSNLRKVKFHSQQGLGFLYAVCKEEYLELIDRQEYQKAFTYLTTHLKPMEKVSGRQEFKDLCYLLTCKSITEVESFRDWEGVVKSREKLAEQLKATFELDAVPTENVNIPDNRLVNLLHQSVAYQMEFSRYHPKTVPKVSTLLRDFECQVLPNAVKTTFVGHSQNVKVAWDLHGHSSRIWYLSANSAGDHVYSASGDGTVKVWNVRNAISYLGDVDGASNPPLSNNSDCISTLTGHSGDVYTVRFWDILSGLCVHTVRQTLGEVTSVSLSSNGLFVLTGSRNNSNRLWDMRMLTHPRTALSTKDAKNPAPSIATEQRPLQRFKGHQNTAKNVVRASFGPREAGSEDGAVYVWDVATGKLLEKLLGHSGVTSSSFDSDDEGDVGEESVESSDKHKLVMEAVCKSCENPYDYNLHLSALSALSGDRVYASQLEQQFERFHEAFPLSLELWLQYIELNPEKLPESFQDYLLPALYYKYVDDLDDDDAKDAEERWSVVLRALGSHWTECENVYHLYRAFLTDSIDDAATLNARVRSSYQGQLLNPYFEGSDRVLSEYRAWSQYQPNPADFTGEQDSIQRRIHSSSALLAKMQTFERNLDKADAADVSALQTLWLEYANFVVSRVSTLGCGVVVSVLERSVAAVCLSGELWGRYLTFLQDKRMKCLDVAKRAVRNVPFESAPWVALFVSMEMEGSTSAEAIHQVGADLCGRQPSPLDQEKRLEVLLAFCDAARRSGSHELLLQAFTMSKPRWVELWDEVLQHRSHEVCAWQSCISECLRVGGTVQETRGYFKRGVAAATDYPMVLAEAWVVFERELGDHVQFWIEAKRRYALLLRQYYVSEVSSSDKSESRKRLLAAEDGSNTGKNEAIDRRQAEYKKQRLSDDTNKTVFLCELDKAITNDDLLNLFAKPPVVKDGVWKTNGSTIYVSGFGDATSESSLLSAFAKDNVDAILHTLGSTNVHVDGAKVLVKRARFSVVEMLEQQAKTKSTQKQHKNKPDQPRAALPESDTTMHKKPRLAFSMVPRSLKASKVNQPSREDGQSGGTRPVVVAAPRHEVDPSTHMKSNDEFRKLYK
ncbi:hypothetical protein DYB38_006468 [Aphanomyces astaci]|uniref:WD40 repeat-containing protein SMU1 n=1 Tax=Aphanomyces astaci TaxID=112090 RepID=A0A397DIA5_APHAT|nr:hypothetical protein DYB38_006468 [Aphanomyces astaci]